MSNGFTSITDETHTHIGDKNSHKFFVVQAKTDSGAIKKAKDRAEMFNKGGGSFEVAEKFTKDNKEYVVVDQVLPK